MVTCAAIMLRLLLLFALLLGTSLAQLSPTTLANPNGLTTYLTSIVSSATPRPTTRVAPSSTTVRAPSTSAKLSVDQKICATRFARFHANHTACIRPNPRCHITKKGISKQDQKLILDVHNYYRNLIASGNESGLGFPGASNMLMMEWDPELAYVAQKHANQCNFEHDCYDCRRTARYAVVGQNLYIYRTTRSSVENQWRYVVKEWYDEIKIAPPEVAKSFDLFDLNIGHFTQIAWAETNRVGCGMVTYDNFDRDEENSIFRTAQLYTCNYAPGGNFLGEKMYETGSPASKCPNKWTRSRKFRSLCELPRKPKSSGSKKQNKKPKAKRVTKKQATSTSAVPVSSTLVTGVNTTRNMVSSSIPPSSALLSSTTRAPTSSILVQNTGTTRAEPSSTTTGNTGWWSSWWTRNSTPRAGQTTRTPRYTWSVSLRYRREDDKNKIGTTHPAQYLTIEVNHNGTTTHKITPTI